MIDLSIYPCSKTYRSAPRDIVVSGISRQEDRAKKGKYVSFIESFNV
jgi:hypothetical protein